MSERNVVIDKLAFGGAGFGRIDGKACFVPFTAPGDEVAIDVTSERRSYCEGKIRTLLAASPLRTEPVCPVFGICGGCSWQHLTYGAQLAQKQAIMGEFLFRALRVPPDRIEPIIPSPDPFGYRSRIQLKIRLVDNSLVIGFYRGGSHFVVDIGDCCPLAHPAINRLLAPLRRLLEAAPDRERIPQVDLAAGEDGRVVLVIHHIGERRQELEAYLKDRDGVLPNVSGMLLQAGRKETLAPLLGSSRVDYSFPGEMLPDGKGVSLSFSGGGFSQVNYPQNRALVATALRLARLGGGEELLDLFSGNGNFSLPLARSAGRVVGVEGYAPSIADARANADANGIRNVRFVCGDCSDELHRLKGGGEQFDLALLDPPRAGAATLVPLLAELAPHRIIYVSCDPATLARDLAALRGAGYGLVTCCPVDMFPQTYHIESVTLLERIG